MRSAKTKKKCIHMIIFLVLLLIGLIFITPFVWMALVSFERYANINPPFPPKFSITEPSVFNFRVIGQNGAVARAYFNSFIIALGSVAVNVFSVMLGGYAFSKGRFRGKKLIFLLVLATMMIPFETRLIPMYKMFLKVNLINTPWPLILPNMVDGFGLMLSKNYFDKLPDSLSEAAALDGAGPMRIFASVFLPLTTPIMATITILKFMDSWNAFLWPLVVLTGRENRTIPILISSFSYEGGTRMAGSTMAVAFIGVIPVLIVFLLLQKYIIQSIALTGLKGE